MNKQTLAAFLILATAACFAADEQPKTHSMPCTPLSKLTNTNTPIDLTAGAIDCIKQDRFVEGVGMYILMGTFGMYDTMRVSDTTTNETISILKSRVSNEVTKDKIKQWTKAVTDALGSRNTNRLCSEIRRIGTPNYYPQYMIEHGKQSQGGITGDPIVKNFNPDTAWKFTVERYLHCK